MFDTMTMTKVVGGLCGSFLVFLLAGFVGEQVYAAKHEGGEHGEAHQAYVIETGAAPETGGEEASGPPADLDALVAAADVAAGEKAFGKCRACHKMDGSNGTGPHLDGVFNRNKAAVAEFAGYSEGMKAASAETWTAANLYMFIENPKKYLPGTKMAFQGLPKSEDRIALIAYLAANP